MRRSLAQKVEDAGYAIQEDGTVIGKRGNKLKPWLQTSGYPVVNMVFKREQEQPHSCIVLLPVSIVLAMT